MSRLPERDLRAHAGKSGRFRLSNVAIGIITLLIFTVGPYLAFTRHIPFTGHGYTLNAVFKNSANIADRSPVRIAGVEVGQVLSTEPAGDATRVTFTVTDEGRPIKEDSAATIRPRIFLEGNFFIDLDPGSPSAEEMATESTIPVSRTAVSVQLDEVLTSLQAPVREDLTVTLEEYGGNALMRRPTRLENLTHDPAARGLTGAEALNETFTWGGAAGRSVSQVLESFRGTEPRDLRRMIAGSARAFGALSANQENLRNLITNFNTFTGALADESENLGRTVALLGPTLETAEDSLISLNAMLPPLRGWASAMTPSLREFPAAIDAAGPWFEQAIPLLSRAELGGMASLLRRSTPGLARASQAGIATTREMTLLGRCTTDVLVPTGDQVIESDFATGQPNAREFFYAMAQVVGETQNFDGNGRYIRVQPGGGDELVIAANPRGFGDVNKYIFSNTDPIPIGTRPQLGTRPPKRPDVACHTNEPTDINGPRSQTGPPSPQIAGSP